MVVDFFVRIFIYGLSGFVLGNGQTTVLLPTAANHRAFVAFENATCSPQPCPTVDQFQRLPLAGDQIDIPQLVTLSNPPGHQKQGRPKIVDELRGLSFDVTLPVGDSDSVAIDWMAPMDQLGNPGTVDKDCIAGASNITCNKVNGGLKGRLVLGSGLLSTCRLIETSAAPPCKGEVHTFHFDHTSGPVEQALAEIEVDVTKVTASGLTLTLTKLGDSQLRETVTLAPVKCVGDPAAFCVDIFIGNMPDPQFARDCSVQKQGDHFTALYALLAPGPTAPLPIPIQDVGHLKPASSVQPVCRQVPSAGDAKTMKQFQALAEVQHLRRFTDEDRKQEKDFDAYLGRAFQDPKYPNQRPICPMATFNPPSSQ
jgi:hypothetical protein